MTILDTLLAHLPEDDAPVRSLLVGAHWTLVCSRHCGLASTLASPHPHGHSQVRQAGNLLGQGARQLAELARSEELMEASIGIAAINSLLDVDESPAVEINASEVLIRRGRGRNVALIGHFPFIPRLRQSAGRLWVIEQHPTGDEYPAHAAPDLLPQADLVAITASALINHTLDDLLSLCPSRAVVVILGPTTPLSPILFDYGATLISGARVVDEAAVLRTVSQGASFRQVQGVKLLTFARNQEAL